MRFTSPDTACRVAILSFGTAYVAQTTGQRLGNFSGIRGFYSVSLGGFAVIIFLILSGMIFGLHYWNKKIDYPLSTIKRCLGFIPSTGGRCVALCPELLQRHRLPPVILFNIGIKRHTAEHSRVLCLCGRMRRPFCENQQVYRLI